MKYCRAPAPEGRMKHVLATLVLLASASVASANDMVVSTDWLAEHRGEENLVLLHVGVPADFEKEHIPGAIPVNPQDLSIPRAEGALALQLLPLDQLHVKLESYGIGDDSRVIVYFAKDWVSPATRVYFSLDAAGLGERTSILDGGMPAWKAAGGTVVSSVNDPASAIQRKPGKITAKPRPELVADLGGIFDVLDSESSVDAVLGYAYRQSVSQIVVGESQRSRWKELMQGSFVARLIRATTNLDIHVMRRTR